MKEEKQQKLGTLITTPAQRDAVHIAIAPVSAGEMLLPGENVRVDPDGNAWHGEPYIGVVDPFLKDPLQIGQRFYICLYPGTVTGLRHEWDHPSLHQVEEKKGIEALSSILDAGIEPEEDEDEDEDEDEQTDEELDTYDECRNC